MPDGGVEIGLRLIGFDAAPGQHARQQFRHAGALRDGQRARSPARVEPVAPGAPGHRARDAQEEALVVVECHCGTAMVANALTESDVPGLWNIGRAARQR